MIPFELSENYRAGENYRKVNYRKVSANKDIKANLYNRRVNMLGNKHVVSKLVGKVPVSCK